MALVRKIIPQSTVDGPGNRTAVFLQGCNIRCAYCHNPETQALRDPEAREMSVAEVVAEIQKGVPFIRGITVSGGECMLQPDFLTDLFTAVRKLSQQTGHPLTCLIDSNGTIPFSRYEPLMEVCDGVMLDVKAWDNNVYHRLTKAQDNEIVKQNLVWLLEQDKLTEVRIVCVPGWVDVENVLRHIATSFDSIGKYVPVRLLRFRPHGVVGELVDSPMPTDEQMEQYAAVARSLNLTFTIK
jgi:pyruvate formate lyase activating enzyme